VTPVPDWRYLTRELPLIAGQIKVRDEDFAVEEIPAYPCSGEGEHVYFTVEKQGLTTLEMVRQVARALGRREHDVGFAGLKDAHAVTRQMLSLEHIDPSVVQGLDIPRVRVLAVDRHRNKLKLGHLAGNRFRIKIRGIAPEAAQVARDVLQVLEKRGVPNYFGLQRFGVRRDSWLLGRAIIRKDPQDFLDQFCGRPVPEDRDIPRRARELYDRGEYGLAAKVWPGFFRDARRVCHILAGPKGTALKAFYSVDKRLKRLFVSAYQSYLFNQVLSERLDTFDRVVTGDLAYKHANGAAFWVEEAEAEQPRAAAFEISPTGPLFGYRMSAPKGEPARLEERILAEEGLGPDDFRNPLGHKVKGSRRPLRIPLADLDFSAGRDEWGDFLFLAFRLPAGAYATAVLRELMKDSLANQDQKAFEGE